MNSSIKRWFVWLMVLGFSLAQPALAANDANDAKEGKSYKQKSKDVYETRHQGENEGKHAYKQEHEGKKDKSQKEKDDAMGEMMDSGKGKPEEPPGLVKQQEKKMEQERKDLGKGSETGQQQREEHSRKWWKFWE